METTTTAPSRTEFLHVPHRYRRGTVASGVNAGMPTVACAKCGNGPNSKAHRAAKAGR